MAPGEQDHLWGREPFDEGIAFHTSVMPLEIPVVYKATMKHGAIDCDENGGAIDWLSESNLTWPDSSGSRSVTIELE